jgi:hypothetical protein
MSLSGRFAVSSTGAATYSVPIALPPGTAAMAPILSLEYGSQNGNGVVGIGWALSGLPSITRCPRTMAQDGALGGINYDVNDRFCMEGQRLVAISGTYGADGTQYRTEIETYSKIISRGAAGVGPAWFEVHTKSGQIMEFGNTTDSRILAQGKSSTRVWAVNKVRDTKSNYFSVTYTNDATSGQYYPNRIDYTGNTTESVIPYNSVQFVYATRPDIVPQYQAGSLIQTTVRLTDVKTYAGSTLVSDYRLTYQQSGPANRSRMTSVAACDTSGTCLPATNVTWTNPNPGFGSGTIWNSAYGFNDGWTNTTYPRMLADVNGDGLPDVVGFGASDVYVALNTGTSFGAALPWLSGYGINAGWIDNNTTPRMLIDVNGDGLPDIVGFGGAGAYVSLNTGTSFAAPQLWTSVFGVAGGWSDNNTYPRMLVDVNGDGLPDVVGFGASDVYVALNTGTSFGAALPWLSGYGISTGWSDNATYPRILADVNGDGLADLVAFGPSDVYVALNTGTSFAGGQVWTSDYGATSSGWASSSSGGGRLPALFIDHPRALIDVLGNGFAGIVGFGNVGVHVSPNTASGPLDLVSSVVSGLGVSTTISYAPATNQSVVSKGAGTAFPTLDLVVPMYVVSRVDATNGVGGTYSSAYTYAGAKADLSGRGFLGFARTSVKDLQTGISDTTTYRQDFPYIGLVASTTRTVGAQTLGQSTNTYQFSNAGGAASVGTPSSSSAPYRVSLSQNISGGADLDGSALPTVTTANQYDAYNNATQVVISTPDGFSKATTNTYVNDVTNWYLGRLIRASVANVAP